MWQEKGMHNQKGNYLAHQALHCKKKKKKVYNLMIKKVIIKIEQSIFTVTYTWFSINQKN